MLFRVFGRYLFSSAKVPLEAVKRLRDQTSSSIGDCKKALEETDNDHEKAMRWLKEKGLASANKRAMKQTREGVIATYLTPCRSKALMLQVNCETDFVAKNQLFLKLVDGIGAMLLEKEQGVSIESDNAQQNKQQFDELLAISEPSNIFPEQSLKNLNEQLKMVISRLQQNIRIRRVITLHSDYCRYGSYVHQPYKPNIGLQACVVEISKEPYETNEETEEAINQFSDDMATQILGMPPKYYNYDEIPMEEIVEETTKVAQANKATLQKAPVHIHESILAGKLHNSFYSQYLLGSMPYILSNDNKQVSQIWDEVQQQNGCSIGVQRAVIWHCK